MTEGDEQDIGGILFAAFEMAPAEVSVGLPITRSMANRHVSSRLITRRDEETTLLAGDKDAVSIRIQTWL